MSKPAKLTKMQQHYLWLAGSFPHLVVEQGRGYRGWPLKYGFAEDSLIIFGYSTPLYFMEGRYFRKLQAPRSWTMTEEGETEFKRLLVSGFGLKADIKQVVVSQREMDV